MLLLETF